MLLGRFAVVLNAVRMNVVNLHRHATRMGVHLMPFSSVAPRCVPVARVETMSAVNVAVDVCHMSVALGNTVKKASCCRSVCGRNVRMMNVARPIRNVLPMGAPLGRARWGSC